MGVEDWLLFSLATRDPQKFGDYPIGVRDSNHYLREFTWLFVDRWDQLIDWKERADKESQVLIKKLKEKDCKRILDVATGTGFDSIQLIKAGFDVASLDGSFAMLTKARENSKKYGCKLRTFNFDWRTIHRNIKETFDAVICLGNSFSHLFSEEDHKKVLREFHDVIKTGGILVIDQLVYRKLTIGSLLNLNCYYSSRQVEARVEYIDQGLARISYQFPDKRKFYLNLCPFEDNYLMSLLVWAGFDKITTLWDFDEYANNEADFIIYIAEKI